MAIKETGHDDDFFEDEGILRHDNKPFTDDRLPRNFVPFNVLTIGNDIVVTYALHFAGNPFETPAPAWDMSIFIRRTENCCGGSSMVTGSTRHGALRSLLSTSDASATVSWSRTSPLEERRSQPDSSPPTISLRANS